MHRVGAKYPDSWHYNHMYDPRTMSPGSIMPAYPWLIEDDADYSLTPKKIAAMRTMGVPYEIGMEDQVYDLMDEQAAGIVASLKGDGIEVDKSKEIVPLIAYLQRMGTDIKNKK